MSHVFVQRPTDPIIGSFGQVQLTLDMGRLTLDIFTGREERAAEASSVFTLKDVPRVKVVHDLPMVYYNPAVPVGGRRPRAFAGINEIRAVIDRAYRNSETFEYGEV